MATAPTFDKGLYDPQQQPPKRSGWQNCLIGCLVVCGGVGLLVVIFAIWVAYNWRTWAAAGVSEVAKQAIAESDLPAEEKVDIQAQVDRVAGAFRDGQMSMEQLVLMIEKLVESPLMGSLMVTMVDTKYLDKSNLPDEEKSAGRETLRRFVRGAIDEKIPQPEVDAVIDLVGTRDPEGGFELKEALTDEELRAFFAAAKSAADQAGVPEQVAPVDPSDEFKRVVDEALANPAAAQP
jgi:hypothetical protein